MGLLSTVAGTLDKWGYGSWKSMAFFVLVPVVGGSLSGLTMGDSVKTWYKTDLKKPSWTPPNWAFPVVWPTLYTLMGVASYRAFYFTPRAFRAVPMTLYGTQLVLNFLWSPVFFRWQRFGLALVNLGSMIGTVAMTAVSFSQHDSLAGALLAPYLAWISYAASLNGYIWWHNPKFRLRKGHSAGAGGSTTKVNITLKPKSS
ncbi:hypothetical protein AMAG_09645 [Allomyces macrogynus ATCC 38327]|uniref:Tryptophan-rich sensory protein n=1 Tax=Allomyces macrogynus (strain ATCC 38327) TaxID=578462 RepID=A0A0L0SSV8_ALLM3|nr:hypothetical protein AMAG_09645 [Allomyces macrogynus ATCC 38327]|eukprot:KNE65663.1 hypothetical protein AMAG_09645 [Allomyces macrogynus ATCC 38327]